FLQRCNVLLGGIEDRRGIFTKWPQVEPHGLDPFRRVHHARLANSGLASEGRCRERLFALEDTMYEIVFCKDYVCHGRRNSRFTGPWPLMEAVRSHIRRRAV